LTEDVRIKQAKRASEIEADTQGVELSLGGLEDLLGFHIRVAQAALYRDFAGTLAKLDLTQRQFAVLELLRANPGASQVDLARVLSLDRPAMMTVIDRLEERRLVIRQRSSSDRRRQEIRLTETGGELLQNASKLVRRHDARFISKFRKAEAQALISALKRVYGDAADGS
jgi:DNA-binding MarR family transcriptional regulator